MGRNFAYLADLFPPSHSAACPKCEGRPYVFGIPEDDPSKEVLACASCGYLFHYPCSQCGQDRARPEGKDLHGFSYICEACGYRYHKPPGWLERPPAYQEKIQCYFESRRSEEERVAEALR